VQLETERLLLRLPQLEDVDDLLELIGDDEVMRWIGGEAGGRAEAIEHVERWQARWDKNGVGQFAVVLDGRVIGRVGLLVWDDRTWETSSYELAGASAVTELGWAVAQRHWGNGYATESARAVREWAYAQRGLERLISLIAPDNVRSARVAEKLGAQREREVATDDGPANVWVHPHPGV
jgi:RimJ/RimL family protein N-acetyltransferase